MNCHMHAEPLLPPNAGPKSRPGCSTALSQAVAMQQMLLADALKPETPPRERAQVACAWEKLEERKRILRMRPKPRDIDTTKTRRKSALTGSTGPIEVPPEELTTACDLRLVRPDGSPIEVPPGELAPPRPG